MAYFGVPASLLNRLRTRVTSTSASWNQHWSYGYNQANQRIRAMNNEFCWDNGYDAQGQVVAGAIPPASA